MQMIKAHEAAMAEQPWLKMIGWDAIISRSGPVVFEGNYAQMRLPRRTFLTWANLYYCLTAWCMPDVMAPPSRKTKED